MRKHTPGFWFCDGMIQEVSACGPTDAGPEQQEANARLIAAAPELLEALRGVQTMQQCGQLEAFAGEPWLVAVQAAIAKATGGKA